jgi:hypothetical protein
MASADPGKDEGVRPLPSAVPEAGGHFQPCRRMTVRPSPGPPLPPKGSGMDFAIYKFNSLDAAAEMAMLDGQ